MDPPASTLPNVGAVIVQYGNSDVSSLLSTLLRDARIGAVVVVRNPRTGIVTDESLLVPTVVLPENLGYGAAANEGRSHRLIAELPLHLILTHDVELAEGAVDRLVRTLEAHQRIAIAGPLLGDGVTQRRIAGGTRTRWGRVRHQYEDAEDAGRAAIIDVTWLDGAAMLIRSDSVPLFDTRYFLYVEDVALCLSVQPRFRVVVVRSARATQRSGMTARPGAHAYLLTRNHILLARSRQEPGARSSATLRAALSISAHALRWMTSLRPHHLRQLAGVAWGFVDGIRGVTGAPPLRLQRWGDIATSKGADTLLPGGGESKTVV